MTDPPLSSAPPHASAPSGARRASESVQYETGLIRFDDASEDHKVLVRFISIPAAQIHSGDFGSRHLRERGFALYILPNDSRSSQLHDLVDDFEALAEQMRNHVPKGIRDQWTAEHKGKACQDSAVRTAVAEAWDKSWGLFMARGPIRDAFAARSDIRTAANKARTAVFAHRDGLERELRPMFASLLQSKKMDLIRICPSKLDMATELRLASSQAADVMHSDDHPIELASAVENDRLSQGYQFEWSGFIYGNAWRPIGRSDNKLHRDLKLVLTVGKLVLVITTYVKQDHRDARWEDTEPRVYPQYCAENLQYRRRATDDHKVRRQFVVLSTAGKLISHSTWSQHSGTEEDVGAIFVQLDTTRPTWLPTPHGAMQSVQAIRPLNPAHRPSPAYELYPAYQPKRNVDHRLTAYYDYAPAVLALPLANDWSADVAQNRRRYWHSPTKGSTWWHPTAHAGDPTVDLFDHRHPGVPPIFRPPRDLQPSQWPVSHPSHHPGPVADGTKRKAGEISKA